jgi:hypothetical protein
VITGMSHHARLKNIFKALGIQKRIAMKLKLNKIMFG